MSDNGKLRFSIEIDLDKANLGPEKEKQVWKCVAELLVAAMPPNMLGEMYRQMDESRQKLSTAGDSRFKLTMTEDADGALTSAVSCTPLSAN